MWLSKQTAKTNNHLLGATNTKRIIATITIYCRMVVRNRAATASFPRHAPLWLLTKASIAQVGPRMVTAKRAISMQLMSKENVHELAVP
jgi:hypothetical protein